MTDTLEKDVETAIEPVDPAVVVIDTALREFATRHAVPAKIIIDPISEIDPVCADRLRAFVSQIHDDPGVLHMRDALNLLLDLRNALT